MNGTGGVAGGPSVNVGNSIWIEALGGSGFPFTKLPSGNAGQYRYVSGGSALTSPPGTFVLSTSGYLTGFEPFWFGLD